MRWSGQIRESKMGLSLFNPQSTGAFTHIETLKMPRLNNLQRTFTDQSNPVRCSSSRRCKAIWWSQSTVHGLLKQFNELGDMNDRAQPNETRQQPDKKTIIIAVYQLKPIALGQASTSFARISSRYQRLLKFPLLRLRDRAFH